MSNELPAGRASRGCPELGQEVHGVVSVHVRSSEVDTDTDDFDGETLRDRIIAVLGRDAMFRFVDWNPCERKVTVACLRYLAARRRHSGEAERGPYPWQL